MEHGDESLCLATPITDRLRSQCHNDECFVPYDLT